MTNSINFSQATNAIKHVGAFNTILLQGQPGVGKSAILSQLAREMPDYFPAYIDCTNLDLGDVAMPVIDRDQMVTHYAPNARFGIGRGQNKPVLLMLDELGKAAKPVLNMLLPIILERRLGDVPLPTGSIVFATTNLATDGVGDNIPAHAYNRMTVVDFANPTCDEWLAWASSNGVVPEVLAFAKQFPIIFDRYDQLEADDKNPYIFNPLNGQTRAFCSPRSLTKASNLIAARSELGDSLLSFLIGTVGESAARDMEAMVHLADQIPTYDAVVANPSKAKLPTGVGGYFLMAFMLAGRVKKETLDPVLEYVDRWTNFEASTLFVTTLATNANKVGWACGNRTFTKKCAALGKFF
jgi:hypothetical protein